MQARCCSARSVDVVQMASGDMEMRVRAELGLPSNQQVEWSYKSSDFSPAVRQLDIDGDQAVLEEGKAGQVC